MVARLIGMIRGAAGMIDVDVAAVDVDIAAGIDVKAAAEIVADVGGHVDIEGMAPETDQCHHKLDD